VKAAVLVGVLLAAAPGFAQSGVVAGPDEQLRIRFQVGVMERILEQAVQLGAQKTGLQMQSLMPNLSLFTGPARARGFKLDGYGMFFDVEVPALRRSVTWSIRTLNQPDASVASALKSLRDHIQSIGDRPERAGLERALRELEMQVGAPPAASPSGASPTFMATGRSDAIASASAANAARPARAPDDPGDSYTEEVKDALIDAMLEHSGPMGIGPEEWLTVAARDNEERLAPGDLYEVLTIVLRIKGADLAAFRAERLTREEARNRVEVREF
jgi:hypothetical protein